jgi:hypothetical protein
MTALWLARDDDMIPWNHWIFLDNWIDSEDTVLLV